MKLFELLSVTPGVTALIGSGGKTSLMYHLCSELRRQGTVLLTTTTHIYPPEQFPLATTAEACEKALREKGVVCAGTPAENGKWTAPAFDGWQSMADFVLVEADGAHGLPLKAHLSHEPVIPDGANNVICVVGASGWGQPIVAAAHRSERFAALAGVGPLTKATPEHTAAVIAAEGFAQRVFVNQTDALPRFSATFMVKDFAKAANLPTTSGSLRQGTWQRIR